MIRAATRADLSGVVALERASATAPHWPDAVYADMIAASAGHCLLVAEDGSGRLTGFAAGAIVAGEGELENIVVAVEAQRRGVGSALCEAMLAWCGSRGATVMRLEVRSAGTDVIRLYERLGFMSVGRRPGYYADPADDALLMERRPVVQARRTL